MTLINNWIKNYQEIRPNTKIIIDDARFINIKSILKSANALINIDFLSLGLEITNGFTLSTLENLINNVFDEYKCAIIIFKYNFYRGNWKNTREKSKKLLNSEGYQLLFPDVTK